ncbi:ArnT family glycosyltransferase [Terriglobus aquaticus]|uniref:ArnT family glycosyltransferase n=1 Tax=Terriglobus aquaticus TaxID=940139 RepID=A0ABW9KHW5_9BACT|nr:glycosyltransferase family 39 protein [Terriglobus aquaticus]
MNGRPSESSDGLFRLRSVSRRTLVLALLLFLAGTVLRLHRFPAVPVGLQQDEVSEAYEAKCLLETGSDRWGNRYPAYFLSWGSGQNVLQAYLTIPFVAADKLTPFTARIIPLLCGILTLPLIFVTAYLWYGELAGLAALAILAFCPWHIFISRIGIENTPLPFFLLLGTFTWTLALQNRSRVTVALCLVPFAAAAYTYGIAIVLLMALLPLLGIIAFREIRQRPRAWSAAFALFLLLTAPLGLFLVKNHVTKREMPFEKHLPFSVPLLTVTRFDQIQSEAAGPASRVRSNLHLVMKGLWTDIPTFQVPGRAPLPKIIMILSYLGAASIAVAAIRRRRFRDPFLAWTLACVPIILFIPLNTSRAVEFGVPIVMLAAAGLAFLASLRSEPLYRGSVLLVAGLLFAVPVVRFLPGYFSSKYASEVRPYTYPDLPAALHVLTEETRGGDLAYVSDGIALNYVQVLFYLDVDPRTFQAAHPTVENPDFANFRFARERIQGQGKPVAFLLTDKEAPLCDAPSELRKVGAFLVGRCL